MKAKDIEIGSKIYCFKIVGFSHKDKRHRKYWEAVCDCGTKKIVHGSAVVSGNTKSCGCFGTNERKARRISPNHSDITAIILGYKRHAIDRGFMWNLTRQEVEIIINSNCYYCGVEPSNTKKTKNSLGEGLKYNGIDRIDSSKNYEKINVVPACKICNYAKSNLSLQQFKEWAKRLDAMADQWGKE